VPSSRSVMHVLGLCAAALSLVTLPVFAAPAQGDTAQLRVGVFTVAPFVMEKDGSLTGFSIELWDAIAEQLNVKTSYQPVYAVTSALEDVRSHKLDVVATPIFITSARDREFDFSYPVMDSGLGILVHGSGDSERPMNPLEELLNLLLSPMILVWLGIALLLLLIPAHVVWLLDRHSPEGITHGTRYFPGILHAMFWAATVLVSQVQEFPRHWFARILSLVWMFVGVVFVAFYTAQLTSTLTVQKIRGAIEGPADLPGKQVATLQDSTAVEYLRSNGTQVQQFATTDQVFQALLENRVDAAVLPEPLLLYYAAHEGKGRVKVVGPVFNMAPVAMLFPLDSPLRKKVDNALITLRENGTFQRLYDKWFGSP